MQAYEIRVLNVEGAESLVTAMVHLSDHAAIRAAQKMAGAKSFEVWRDGACIYGRAAHVTGSLEGIPAARLPA